MPHPPSVSVIIPTFNRPAMLEGALESLAAQHYGDFEVIVINDAGDEVGPVLARFPALRTQLITHAVHQGQAAARNTGLKAASGRYVAFLDDDDVLFPHHLDTLVARLEADPACALAYADAQQAVQELEAGAWRIRRRFVCHSVPFHPTRLLVDNHLAIQCVLMRREVYEAIGGFDTSLPVYEDWEFWIRASRRFAFAHVPVVTSEYRVRRSHDRISVRHRGRFLGDRFAVWRRHGWLPAVLLAAALHFTQRLFLRAVGKHRPAIPPVVPLDAEQVTP